MSFSVCFGIGDSIRTHPDIQCHLYSGDLKEEVDLITFFGICGNYPHTLKDSVSPVYDFLAFF